ncbi:MAG: nitroreductase family protein [Oryzomonas sp.]|uniref:nitroreductase family protein n=1 Tax=Oryzomonas sp. TaxID=2855186 RepID=UPI00284E41E5|nr:nitroreductase family protein [Oryzomonas sp.]MDR3579228.1 nitroreductase family protein [Oryzomonas sp.]
MRNDVLKVIEDRRSIRVFDDRDISESDIQTVLQAANQAPSAHNQQSWRFAVVSGIKKQNLASLVSKKAGEFPKTSAALLRMAARSISSAPVVVGVINTGEMVRHATGLFSLDTDDARDFFRTMEIQSSAAAVENLLLAATSLGISSVWLGVLFMIKDDVLSLLEEPGGEFMAIVALGYSEKKRMPPPKKSLETTVRYL